MISRRLFFLALFVSLIGCGQSQTDSISNAEFEQPNDADAAKPASSDEIGSIEIRVGMPKETVSEILSKLGASDISSGMQATAEAPNSDWMWTLDSPKLSIETLFENEKLTTMNIWDWRGRKMTSYHHTMKYDQVDSLIIKTDGSFKCNVIQTHNATEN